MSGSLVAPELVWGLVPRLVGVLYVIAFGGVITQLEAIIGSRGLAAIKPRLDMARRDYPGLSRFLKFPTVLWLSSSDRAIRLLPWIGVALGLCLIYGGPLSPYALALAWLLWLSLEPAAMIFPWDTMLQEVGFLTLFLPTPEALPLLTATELPWPTVTFMFRWLVLRLMLGFGKVKFVGSKQDDALYLRGFFVWMPSPTPLAWFGHHLPSWILRCMLYFMFLAEVIAPLLGFFSGPLRIVSYAILVQLMIGIHATGNWGFFNIGYILLCTCLLDTEASIFDLGSEPWASQLWQWPHVASNAVLLLMFVTGILYLVVLDSWTCRTIINWPLDIFSWNRRWLRVLLAYLRLLAPFRIVNGYGVFPPRSGPPVRSIPVFEGSDDGGVTWKAYRYRFMATDTHERNHFVAPYQARVDMAVCYSGACIYDSSFYGSLIGDGTPYTCYTRSSWLDRLCQRLLNADPMTLRLFGRNPFPDAPPTLMRVTMVAMTPSTPEVRRATGALWHTRNIGVFVRARGKEDWPDALMVPEAEVYHPDWVEYKRAAAPLRAMIKAYQSGVEPDRAVLTSSDLTAEDVRRFWGEFVPMVQEARGDFSRFIERSDAVVARFGMVQVSRFERVLERLAWLLRMRTERHQFAKVEPKIPLESNFRYHMFLQEMVLDGSDAYLSVLADPTLAAKRFERSNDGMQLWGLALMRGEVMLQHVRAFRWSNIGSDNYDMKIPGLFEYYPILGPIVPPDEEFMQVIKKLPNGEHTIDDFYPPPQLA